MIFLEATVKNYNSYGPTEQVVRLNENGIKLLVAPNGYGKSSIFYSIVYTLYGKTNQDSVDDVVNRYVGKNCKTSVTFMEDGKTYKVIRYRKHEEHDNNVYIFDGNKDISLKKIPDTNQLILDIIKMPYQAFINSTFFSTELYSKFMKAKTSERLSVFESLLSMKEVTLFFDQAKKFRNLVSEQITETNTIKVSKQSEISGIENTIETYVTESKASILSLKKEKENLLNSIEDNKKKIEEYSSIDIEAELNKNTRLKRIEEINQQINELQSSIETEVEMPLDKLKTYNYLKDVDFKSEIEKENRKKLLLSELEELNKSLEKVDTEDRETISAITSCENLIDSIRDSIRDKKKEKNSLESGECPYCHQHVDSDFSHLHSHGIEEELNSLEETLKEEETNLTFFKNKKEQIEISQEELILKISNVKIEQSNIIYDNAIDKLEKAPSDLKVEFENAEYIVNNVNSNNKSIEARNSKIEESINQLKGKLLEIGSPSKYSEEFLNNLKTKIDEINKDTLKLEKEIALIEGKALAVYDKKFVDSQKKKIDVLKEEIKGLDNILSSLEEDEKYYNYLMNCFSNKENSFKKFFIGQMIDTFNEKINQYLPFFFEEDIEILFDRDLNVSIKLNGYVVSINSFSSGQKSRADMSVAFALFNLSRIFFSNESNLLVVDEILDMNVDSRGIESALTIVEGFGYDTSVFIVSHNQDIKDRVKNKIEITRDSNGFSIIK